MYMYGKYENGDQVFDINRFDHSWNQDDFIVSQSHDGMYIYYFGTSFILQYAFSFLWLHNLSVVDFSLYPVNCLSIETYFSVHPVYILDFSNFNLASACFSVSPTSCSLSHSCHSHWWKTPCCKISKTTSVSWTNCLRINTTASKQYLVSFKLWWFYNWFISLPLNEDDLNPMC